MARNGKAKGEAGDSFESGAATPGHNLATIKETVQSVRSALDGIDKGMDELKADKREQRAKLKALGINLKEFDIARRYASFDDQDKRNESLDWLRVCFEAMGIGEQGSLFPDAGAAQQPSA